MDGEAQLSWGREGGHDDPARSVLDAIAVGYLVTRGTRIIDINQNLCATLGFSRDELVDLEMPWPFTPPESLELTHAITERLSRDALDSDAGPSDPIELRLMRKDGSRFVGELTVAPARDANGTILAWVSTIRDISRSHDYEVELERLATHDPLTGLANRRLFEERLGQEMADAIRHSRSLAVAILDLDHFKSVNDQFGHPAGDDALRESSARLERIARKGDLLARVGGEEFAWILPEVHSHGAWAAVERARHAISDTPFDAAGSLTISIGVALRGDLQEAAQLYEQADESLYRAKREGRDRSVMWRSL
jgi:diguanylate cyclase (GGDEF)-like protein/PAS domain S-box-containing protein